MTAEAELQLWAKAACVGQDQRLWFPEDAGAAAAAKRVCAGCEVRAECLAHALDHDERHGIWGGLNTLERNRLRAKPLSRYATRPRITPGDGDRRHGTRNGYANLSCRCAACTAANRRHGQHRGL